MTSAAQFPILYPDATQALHSFDRMPIPIRRPQPAHEYKRRRDPHRDRGRKLLRAELIPYCFAELMPLRKIILKNELSPGDIVMLTAAVRDLHANNPGEFLTDVRTTARDLWKHNPHIVRLDETAGDVETLTCHYPLIHRSNQLPHHFIFGFEKFLSDKLGVRVEPTAFRGDIHLSAEEKARKSQVHEILGRDVPFWIVVAGGKNDYTIKWWETERYQAVVDHFRGKILFVQIGEKGHSHPPLHGVLDLRGKTDIRQLVQLMYHSQGVVSPVTFAMHLAAAVETKTGATGDRPCVVIAGGREPVQWEAYPWHRFLHTQGALKCCATGGCWKSRTLPLGDGDKKDLPENLCRDVIGRLPRCMDMIRPEAVIAAVESYFEGGALESAKGVRGATKELAALGAGRKMPERNGNRRVRSKPRNRVALRVSGMRRSGLHPVVNWLAGLYGEPACFVNDVNHQDRIGRRHASDHLPAVTRTARLDEEKELLIVSYEDERLVNLGASATDGDLYGVSGSFRDVLILRDPFNLFASRLQLHRQRPDNLFAQGFLMKDAEGVSWLPLRWKFMAEEFAGRTNHLANGKLVINFNRWVVDTGYRKDLCEILGRPFRDNHREAVPRYGFGSSFDGLDFDGRGATMGLFERWRRFENDPEFLAFFADPEILELSESIFGDSFNHGPLRDLVVDRPEREEHGNARRAEIVFRT